jgi:hypothetical protein
MSFSFSALFDSAETVLTDVLTGAEAIAPILPAIPGAGAVATDVESGVSAAQSVIASGKTILNDVTPAVTAALSALEAAYNQLFHITATPGAVVLTPKTSVATKATTSAATKK